MAEEITGIKITEERKGKPTGLAQTVTIQERAADLLTQAASTKRTLTRTAIDATPETVHSLVIRKGTEAMQFKNYLGFMDIVLCGKDINSPDLQGIFTKEELALITKKDGKADTYTVLKGKRHLPYTDTDAYRLLKVATEAFLMVNCGVWVSDPKFTSLDAAELNRRVNVEPPVTPDDLNSLYQDYLKPLNGTDSRIVPYLELIRRKLPDVPIKAAKEIFGEKQLPEDCYGILQEKLTHPCMIELIWSYWHEEGMLVQTMNAISLRFQNVRGQTDRDPLAMFELDPLRPLNNLLWGYIQDEQHRLSVIRRAYEYDHHYGLTLQGKAVPALRTADSRSKFLEGFHNLLYLCWLFFKEDDDTTVVADGFPVLNALKEVHLCLTEGMHNQFGDLPCTGRIEMLMQQWLLARPEFRESLPTRIMVGYPEPWMDRVDAMKRLQGWTDVSVREFHDLGVFGERLLLSIRFIAWLTIDDPVHAAGWARIWRPEIQGYIHSYRAVTGVDLTTEVTDTRQAARRSMQPSILLRERLAAQQRQLPGSEPGVAMPSVPLRARPLVGRRG
jgi:hypothetical protein